MNFYLRIFKIISKFVDWTERNHKCSEENRTSGNSTITGTTESSKSYHGERNAGDIVSAPTGKDSDGGGNDPGKGIDGEGGSLPLSEVGQSATFEQQQQVHDAPQQQTDNLTE